MPDAMATAVSRDPDPALHEVPVQAWHKRLAAYAKPDGRRAAGQLAITAGLLLATMAALLYALDRGYWPALLLALPAALFVVRLFIIQHDCGHGAFFGSWPIDRAVGLALSTVTMMPFASWRRAHAVHHATSGNLDRRGTGDIATLTVAEYLEQPAWRRFLYRLYRHPLVLFGLGPAYVLLIRYRVPVRNPARDWENWLSILGTDAAATLLVLGMSLVVGPVVFLTAWGIVLLLATSIGIWLFYVQHQFEDTYWERSAAWDFHTAALEGSSFYDLPGLLHWFTGWIGFHHIHHLASKIPNYRLRACFEQNPELQRAKRVTLWASIKSVRLTLWDEEQRRLVSFRQVAPRCA